MRKDIHNLVWIAKLTAVSAKVVKGLWCFIGVCLLLEWAWGHNLSAMRALLIFCFAIGVAYLPRLYVWRLRWWEEKVKPDVTDRWQVIYSDPHLTQEKQIEIMLGVEAEQLQGFPTMKVGRDVDRRESDRH